MPNVTIIAKEGHNIILQQENLNVVRLTENSVVLVKVQKEDVVSLIRLGNALVVTQYWFNHEFKNHTNCSIAGCARCQYLNFFGSTCRCVSR